MKCLITGANGQLGTELVALLKTQNIDMWAFDSNKMDITDRERVLSMVKKIKPDVIFHCAAYTAVDVAEDEGKELNWLVNVQGTQNVVDAANNVSATLVSVSTDYVFNGTKTTQYEVTDTTNPKNEYGKAKLAGEKIIQSYMKNYYIIRTSWLFGKYGKNFVYTMLKLAENHSSLTVVDDQVGRPTWTRTLAEFMIYVIRQNLDFGTYQLSNDGSCTWYEFAKDILKNKDVNIAPVTSEEYPQKAYRPKHSVMSLEKVKKSGFEIPDWKTALAKFQAELSE